MLKYMHATQTQNVARRLIAFLVIAAWVLMLIVAAVAWPFLPEWSVYITNEIVDVQMTTIVGIIIGFYFLTHTVRSINGNKK